MKSLLIALCTCMMLTVTSFATDIEVEEGLTSFGADELVEEIPYQAQELAKSMDLKDMSFGEIISLSPSQFFNGVKDLLFSFFDDGVKSLFAIVATVLLCAFLSALSEQGGTTTVFTAVAGLAVTTALGIPVVACIKEVSQVLVTASQFMLTYVPVYSAVVAASGHPASATGYSLMVMGAAQVVGQVAAQVIIPLCSAYLALCIAGAVSQSEGVIRLASVIKRMVTGLLAVAMTTFVTVLTLQNFMTTAVDTASIKTTRFLIGAFVPVVGGAIADAVSSAQGCIQVIKGSVGSFGVAIAVMTFLPSLLKLCVFSLVVTISSVVGDVLGVTQIKGVLSAFSSALAVLIALVMSMALLMIISTAIMISFGG